MPVFKGAIVQQFFDGFDNFKFSFYALSLLRVMLLSFNHNLLIFIAISIELEFFQKVPQKINYM